MSKKIALFATTLLFVSILSVTLSGQQPKLIDRELFFGNPKLSNSQISPDGKYLAFMKPYKNVRNIWVKGVDEPFEKARLVTAEQKRPIPNYFWSSDGRFLLFVKDNDGDEN